MGEKQKTGLVTLNKIQSSVENSNSKDVTIKLADKRTNRPLGLKSTMNKHLSNNSYCDPALAVWLSLDNKNRIWLYAGSVSSNPCNVMGYQGCIKILITTCAGIRGSVQTQMWLFLQEIVTQLQAVILFCVQVIILQNTQTTMYLRPVFEFTF